MREIQFRGLMTSGDWVYGTPVFYKDGTVGMVVVEEDRVSVIAVDPETVGEYIGITDKEGLRIYEHDVVEAFTPECISLHGVVKNASGSFYIATEYCCLYNWLDYKLKKWGNIHDNPELVESEQGGI